MQQIVAGHRGREGEYVTLAFYRDGQSKISRFIRWITGSRHYSHVEIILGKAWVTALIGQGVVVRHYDPREHDENYDLIHVKVDRDKWFDTVRFVDDINRDNYYDYLGAFFGNMFNIPIIQDPNKYFCSEVVSDILKRLGDEKIKNRRSSKMTPQMLWDIYYDPNAESVDLDSVVL